MKWEDYKQTSFLLKWTTWDRYHNFTPFSTFLRRFVGVHSEAALVCWVLVKFTLFILRGKFALHTSIFTICCVYLVEQAVNRSHLSEHKTLIT
jgi:hypothetical protein